MARNKNVYHPDVPAAAQPSESPEGPTVTVETPEEEWAGRESQLDDDQLIDDLEHEPDISSEMAQEVWEGLKEEFYEQVEQLPLSLHRSFALIGEQDKEVEACRAELLPTIRSYVKLRQSLHSNVSQLLATQGPQKENHTPVPPTRGSDAETQETSPDAFVACAEQPKVSSERENEECQKVIHTQHKQEDVDIIMGDVPSQPSPRASVSSSIYIAPIPSDYSSSHPPDLMSQSASAHTVGLRETDASVPKSVPFPPRPKPKTTRELLTRISFLMGEVIRASEEKVGLATAAYDSVDRHVRVLDTAIKEHETVVALGLRDGTHPVGMTGPDVADPLLNPTVDDDDEEPQLGMIGPSGNLGEISAGSRRGKKRDRRDQRKHVFAGNPIPQANAHPLMANHELPIDPHEPRYCYCHQVSYGEMIACDNPDCSREWFHLGCAGLDAPPKGKVKWYCRECDEALGRNRRKRIR